MQSIEIFCNAAPLHDILSNVTYSLENTYNFLLWCLVTAEVKLYTVNFKSFGLKQLSNFFFLYFE